jgi:hypothetical protein
MFATLSGRPGDRFRSYAPPPNCKLSARRAGKLRSVPVAMMREAERSAQFLKLAEIPIARRRHGTRLRCRDSCLRHQLGAPWFNRSRASSSEAPPPKARVRRSHVDRGGVSRRRETRAIGRRINADPPAIDGLVLDEHEIHEPHRSPRASDLPSRIELAVSGQSRSRTSRFVLPTS